MKGIPVKRFGEIVREAEKAYKREDWLTIGRLNQELNAINTGMFWQHGKAYLWALTDGKPLPFDDILEEKITGLLTTLRRAMVSTGEDDMTLYRDEDGNLQSDDFIPKLATDEDLLARYRKVAKVMKTTFNEEIAKLYILCSAELGRRGYTTNADETDWYKPDSQS